MERSVVASNNISTTVGIAEFRVHLDAISYCDGNLNVAASSFNDLNFLMNNQITRETRPACASVRPMATLQFHSPFSAQLENWRNSVEQGYPIAAAMLQLRELVLVSCSDRIVLQMVGQCKQLKQLTIDNRCFNIENCVITKSTVEAITRLFAL